MLFVLSIHPSTYTQSIHPSEHPSINASIHPCTHASIHASINASINASIHPCIHASINASTPKTLTRPRRRRGQRDVEKLSRAVGPGEGRKWKDLSMGARDRYKFFSNPLADERRLVGHKASEDAPYHAEVCPHYPPDEISLLIQRSHISFVCLAPAHHWMAKWPYGSSGGCPRVSVFLCVCMCVCVHVFDW